MSFGSFVAPLGELHQAKFQKDLQAKFGSLLKDFGDMEDDEFDDDEYDDDDEDYLEEEGESAMKFMQDMIGFMASSLKQGKVEAVLTPEEKKVVTVDRKSIDKVARDIPQTPGFTQVVAEPGSGKTTVLPVKLKEAGHTVVVVVPSESVLADVGSKMPEVTLHGMSGDRAGVADLQYITADCIKQRDVSPSDGITIVVDEAQEAKADDVLVEATKWRDKNRVVACYGRFLADKVSLPMHIKVMAYSEGWTITRALRVMIVHATQEDAQAAAMRGGYGHYYMFNALGENLQLFEELRHMSLYRFHVTYEQALGLDLDLTAIYVCGYKKGFDGRVESLTIADHVQLAMRVGRRSVNGEMVEGAYFGDPDLRSKAVTSKAKIDWTIHAGQASGVNAKHERRKKGRIKTALAKQEKVKSAVVQSPSISEGLPTGQVLVVEKPQEVRLGKPEIKVRDNSGSVFGGLNEGPMRNGKLNMADVFGDERYSTGGYLVQSRDRVVKFLPISDFNQFVLSRYVYPVECFSENGRNGNVLYGALINQLKQVLAEFEIRQDEALKSGIFELFCALRNLQLNEGLRVILKKSKSNEGFEAVNFSIESVVLRVMVALKGYSTEMNYYSSGGFAAGFCEGRIGFYLKATKDEIERMHKFYA